MRAFIPAGSEIVINRNGQNTWYTTQKEIDVPDYATAPCPLRNALPVLTAEVQGFRVWFLENQIQVELSAEQQQFVANHKFVKVEYDVPAVVSQHPNRYRDENNRSFVHPSQWMWGYAVRTTRSCWLMTEEKYNAIQRRLRGLTRAGCQWEPTWVDASNAARHLERAVVSLRKAWVEADQSHTDCLNRAEEEYQSGSMSVEAERKLRYARNRIEKELDNRREDIAKSAGLYGIPMDWVNGTRKTVPLAVAKKSTNGTPMGLYTVRNANRTEAKNAAEAHCEMVDALRKNGFEKEANAVESGEMPNDVAADFCEDNGIACDENGVFSLTELLKDK